MTATTVAVPHITSSRRPPEGRDRSRRRIDPRPGPVGRAHRTNGPVARPVRAVAPPSLNALPSTTSTVGVNDEVATQGRTLDHTKRTRSHTRLTDRGIAVILVASAMIVLAAATVITLTALRVTGESYQPLVSSSAAHL